MVDIEEILIICRWFRNLSKKCSYRGVSAYIHFQLHQAPVKRNLKLFSEFNNEVLAQEKENIKDILFSVALKILKNGVALSVKFLISWHLC